MAYPNTRLFIGGQWCDAADRKTLAVLNPATGQEIGRVAHAGIADLDRALTATQRGFELWRDGALMTMEQGKPLAEATMSAETIEWFAEEGRRVYGRVVSSRSLAVQQTVLKSPVGPVAAFTPWNFLIDQVVRKLSATRPPAAR